ncbi:alpha-amylase family glycosyl hydrolase [Agathobacter sp.]|uniref:alpha-amylase family glycosyl hydrolase n=1 Tax=Agathobacter sp. TaxID=2021311 RepID=UPI003FD7D6E5
MRKLKERFHRKHGIVSRIFSVVLVLAMILTMIPAIGGNLVKAASTPMNVTIHFMEPSTWGWQQPAVQFWGYHSIEVSNDAKGGKSTEIPGWGAEGYFFKKGTTTNKNGDKDYYLTVKTDATGFQFLDFNNTDHTKNPANDAKLTQYTGDTPTDVYYIAKDGSNFAYYLDAEGEKPVSELSETETTCDLTINYKSTLGDDVAAYIYNETNNKPAGEWPGKVMTAAKNHDGWYTMHLTLDNSTDYTLILNNNNNNGNNKQLDPVTLSTRGKAEAEYWFEGSLSEKKPAGWKYVTTIHYLAEGMGNTIYNHVWGTDESATGAGVGQLYPGGQIKENAKHSGWYDVVYTQDKKQNFGCIFNDGKTKTDDIDVSVTSTSTELWVTGTLGGTKVYKTAPVSWEAPVPDHTFTIYYYNEDLSTEKDMGKVDLWMWNAGLGGAYVFDETFYDAENDVTWFKQTIKVAGSNVGKTVGLKARYDNTKGWDGGSDRDGISFKIRGGENEVLYYVDGSNPVHEKPVIVPTEKRYFVLDYENPGLKEKGITPQFYTWSSGYPSALIDFTYVGGGKWTVKIPAKPSCTKVDFCIALNSTIKPWIKDGGDHSVTFPSDQKVIYASMKAGSEPEIAMPYNVGYEVDAEKQQVSYYYRDDAAFVDGTLKGMNVSVDVNGTEHPMTYNDTTKRFEYVESGLKDGKTHYRYKANGKYVVDAFNSNKEEYNNADYSYFEYYKLHAKVTAEVMNKSFNYNENDVVKFDVKQDSSDTKKLEVASASINVSSLGGSNAMPIEPKLQAVTISATTDTTLGIKKLPITVTDQYGNKFSTTVDVEITDRVKKNENDFDWDEAVVYFMMTDRFFDGNESNNKASGEKTYGKNPGLYHGGDFAGVTAKLDYLQDLGVNTIWITPIVENVKGVDVTGEGSDKVPYNAAYHGYWASDFTKLNPTLGTEKEFETMISEAHKRGMRIMVDIVVNHAGYGTESTFGDMIRNKSTDEGDIKSWQSGLPDFATEKPNVRAKLVEWQTSWMKNYGVDYFRVDTVKHVDSTTWAALKNSTTEVNRSFKMIGEYYGAGYASNGSTLGSGQMDADLDFDFNDQATSFVSGNISSVEDFLSARNSALNNSYMTGQFLSSHDEDGFKAALMKGKGYTKDQATSAALVAATLQLTAKGIPVIYYGEEVGLTGLNNYPYQTNRYDMDFSLATKDNVTYQHYKNLLSIRNAYTDVFARGSRKVVASSDKEGYDVVSRSYGKTTLYVGMNIKDAAKEVKVPVSLAAGTKVKDLYSGATYTVGSDKTVAVTIPAAKDGGTVILVKEDTGKQEATPTPTDKKPAAKVDRTKEVETIKKAAPKSGDDNEAATYVCLLGLAAVAITAATYRKKRACK